MSRTPHVFTMEITLLDGKHITQLNKIIQHNKERIIDYISDNYNVPRPKDFIMGGCDCCSIIALIY